MATSTLIITSVGTCTGGNHITVRGTLNGEQISIETTPEELTALLPDTRQERRNWILSRLVFAMKDANATTNAQRRAAILNQTFKV